MSQAQVLAVFGATIGGFFALLSLAFAKAPGWRELRWFALVAGSAGAFCACELAVLSSGDDDVVRLFARVAMSVAALNVFAWVRYSAGPGRRPLDRVLEGVALALAALALVPGVVLGPHVARHANYWSDALDVDVIATPFGIAGFGVLFAVATVPLVRYLTRWRAGVPGAGAHALALAGFAAASTHDAVDGTWTRTSPHLVPLGLVWMVAAVGSTLARRFVAGACELDKLSTQLDVAVELRTRELALAQVNLAQAQKLAVLGRLSGAVAHEINNPAAAVAANLGYMRDALKLDGKPPSDAAEVIDETLESVDRIARIVRQLGDAGELGLHGGPSTGVFLGETVRRAAEDVRDELKDGVELSLEIPQDLYARTQEGSLRQVVTSLIATAARAMRATRSPGKIRVLASRERDRVFIRVVDPCPEADDALRTRRFEPFLADRPTSIAHGVGLSVSVALLRIFGGEVAIDRSDDDGTSVRIDLAAAEAPPKSQDVSGSSRSPRARLLLVDDDVLVRIGLRRLLGREYVIDEAGSVEEALTCVREHGDDLDAVICDLVMPDGGAGRILEELARIAPQLARATVLMTGGAVDDETRGLLDAHADRVLRKPVDVESIRAMVERVRLRRSDLLRLPTPKTL